MSYFEDASLVYIPSAVKDAKTYSIKPTDGSGDLTFSRGSDIEATRVNANGYIEKAQVNLLLQSNSFSTTWLNQLGGTITGGQSGYDGTNDAWLLSKDTSTFRSIRQVISFAGVVTYSAYVKAGTLSNAALRIDSSAGSLQVLYDLSAGTATLSGGANIAYGIDSIGSGWYRIFVTANISGGTNVHIYVDRDGTTAGNIYVQDAQLNYGLVAQTYQETTTAAVVSGITDNMPRLNYDPANPTCPSLILEPSRTNVVPQSEYFDSGWTKDNCSVVTNATISPEGVQNASKLVENTASSQHYIWYQNIYVVGAGNNNYLTLYAKEGERRYLAISSRGAFSNNDNTLIFDTRDGVWGLNSSSQNTGQTAENVGNGWWRIKVWNVSVSAAYDGFTIGLANGATDWSDTSYTGDGTSGIYIYGAQAEVGDYGTSYIPTYGSSATRTADTASKTGISSLIGQTEGTLFVEFKYNGLYPSVDTPFAILGTYVSNYIAVAQYNANMYARIVAGGVTQGTFGFGVLTAGQTYKCAIGYSSTGFAFYVNGSLVGSNSSATIPATSIFNTTRSGFENSKGINQALVFKTRLPNSELATLTA